MYCTYQVDEQVFFFIKLDCPQWSLQLLTPQNTTEKYLIKTQLKTALDKNGYNFLCRKNVNITSCTQLKSKYYVSNINQMLLNTV